jgi:sugar lactone lactonase YvrE
LFAYSYADGDVSDTESLRKIELIDYPADLDLHTLGLAFDEETSTLFAANHARAGARIETFRLDLAALTATHLASIEHPLIHAPNAIALVQGTSELYVTNDHYFTARRSKLLSQLETYLSPPGGSVIHVDLRAGGVEATVAARLPYANGIEIINSTTVAVASTSGASVYLYHQKRECADDDDNGSWSSPLAYGSRIRLPFLPDNLGRTADGGLLIAGHAHAPSTTRFGATRHVCNDDAALAAAAPAMREYCSAAASPSWVARWSEERGLEHLYVGNEFPTSSTARIDEGRGVGIISGLYAKGILVWRSQVD